MLIRAPGDRDLSVGEGRTRLMGILNVTPDSFSDGGHYLTPETAVNHGLRLVAEGADVLDVGGESTRPGHQRVTADEQMKRILPVIAALAEQIPVPISVDTTSALVASAALEAGAHWINDTSALQRDPELGAVAAAHGCPLVLMHRFEPPRQASGRVLLEAISTHLEAAVQRAQRAGIARDRLLLDPGIGFGTAMGDDPAILAHLPGLRRLGLPLLVGPSRKSFLGHLTGRGADERVYATAAAVATMALQGVEVVRVHDVAAMRDVVVVVDAIRAAGN